MDVDINSEPGPGKADKSAISNNQADSATEIHKSNSESMNVVQDKFERNSNGLVALDIEFLPAEFPFQSDIENCAIEVILTFP